MPGNPDATVYVGNLDERVDERVVYEIMVQAGPLVDVYFPRDKDSKRHKGYGFAEYETEESAQYALRLFSGLVYLCNRSVRFAISGERSAQPARYDPDSSRLFARSHEKDGDSWQMTPPQHPNYVYLNHSPTGMIIVSFGLAEATGLCLHLKYFVLVFSFDAVADGFLEDCQKAL
jgi:RNA recognition motif-containing protein